MTVLKSGAGHHPSPRGGPALTASTDILFRPITIKGVEIPNRIAMAPMTRCFSPGGVPGANVTEYYRKRAAGGVGLIISEGTFVPHAGASNDPNVADFMVILRYSQWKQHDYDAKLVETPDELEQFLQPMVDAGVDVFHALQRRFWDGEFGTDLNLAGWANPAKAPASICCWNAWNAAILT